MGNDNRQPRRKPDTAPAHRLDALRQRQKVQRHGLHFGTGTAALIAQLQHYRRHW